MNRRDLLVGAAAVMQGFLVGAATLNLKAETFSDAAEPRRKLKIIVTGGHPGDPEYGCGGTVSRPYGPRP